MAMNLGVRSEHDLKATIKNEPVNLVTSHSTTDAI
jgi:hypothetical protein